jgi:hypothetical protein
MNGCAVLAFAASVLTASCGGNVRYGIANTPVSEAASDAATLRAIQQSLEPTQARCAVRFLERSEPKAVGPSGTVEKVSVEVCGKKQHYEIQRIRVKGERVMITAKRI